MAANTQSQFSESVVADLRTELFTNINDSSKAIAAIKQAIEKIGKAAVKTALEDPSFSDDLNIVGYLFVVYHPADPAKPEDMIHDCGCGFKTVTGENKDWTCYSSSLNEESGKYEDSYYQAVQCGSTVSLTQNRSPNGKRLLTMSSPNSRSIPR